MAWLRTAFLLGLLGGILLAIGWLIGGFAGLTLALIFSCALNFGAYWWSDKFVLAIYHAKQSKVDWLNKLVAGLAKKASIPCPRVYIVPIAAPNAFATGRNPRNAAIAVTAGLLRALERSEIRAVLAHEIAHIKNRDTLISSIAATIASAINWIAHIAWWTAFGDRDRGSLILFPLIIFAPLAAMLVQLAISRAREYHADYTGAVLIKNPLSLASALQKIASYAKKMPIQGNAATSHLWIVNPFTGRLAGLFSTHPPIEERIKRLKALKV